MGLHAVAGICAGLFAKIDSVVGVSLVVISIDDSAVVVNNIYDVIDVGESKRI